MRDLSGLSAALRELASKCEEPCSDEKECSNTRQPLRLRDNECIGWYWSDRFVPRGEWIRYFEQGFIPRGVTRIVFQHDGIPRALR